MKTNRTDGALMDGQFSVRRRFGSRSTLTRLNNTMSEHAQNCLLGMSASMWLNGASPMPYGRLCFSLPGIRLQDDIGSTEKYSTLFYEYGTNKELGLRLFLLKLTDEELLALNSKSKYIPIKDGNGDLSDKVVAYGSYKVTNTDTKAGELALSDYTTMIKPYFCSNAWVWKANKAYFDYNAFVIASTDAIDTFASYKCISALNINAPDSVITGNFVMPGLTGVTGPNEILLNYTYNGISKWIYNIKTGSTRTVEPNEAGYNMDISQIGSGQVIMDGKLFAIRRNDSTGDISNYIDVYLQDGTMTKSISISSSYYKLRGLFSDGTNLYASTTDNGRGGKMFKIDTSAYSTEEIANDTFGWDNLPSKFDKAKYAYIKASYVVDDVRHYVVGDCKLGVQFICTNLMDVQGSIVSTAPVFDCVFNIDGTESGVYFVCAGTKEFNKSSEKTNNERPTAPMLPLNYILNEGNTEAVDNTYKTKGVWINNNQFSNFLSYYKYDTLQNKTIAQELTITYGYEIGVLP